MQKAAWYSTFLYEAQNFSTRMGSSGGDYDCRHAAFYDYSVF